MRVLEGLESVAPPFAQSVLTIGNFDGVHLAHQQLLAQAGLFAAKTGSPVVVLTFEPHPLTVVAPDKAPQTLSTRKQKLQLAEALGADVVVIAKSEPALLGLTAEDFVRRVIWEKFHPTHIVEGPNFGFGKGRTGTPATLQRIMAEFGSHVHIVDPVTLEIDGTQTMVSSSVVRRLLQDGKVRQAALCLGRPYRLAGTVAKGARRGRTIGFPTINLAGIEQLIPKEHVYAGRCEVDGVWYDAAISIGNTPTFAGTEQRVEAYLLDFDGDLYGRNLELEFTRAMRPQQEFPSADALARQLHRDVRAIRDARDQTPRDPLNAINPGRAKAS